MSSGAHGQGGGHIQEQEKDGGIYWCTTVKCLIKDLAGDAFFGVSGGHNRRCSQERLKG